MVQTMLPHNEEVATFTRIYRLPIQGKVLNDKPLTGDSNDPLCVISLPDLPGYDEITSCLGYRFTVLSYDIDNEECEVELCASDAFHDWLLNLLPQLKSIKQSKGWKLDKTELIKARLARGE